MKKFKIKTVVTLGPATNTIQDLRKIKDKGVDFVRINMSHSSINDLKYYIGLAKQVGISFIIDSEGSQIRTGLLKFERINLEENDQLLIYSQPIIGDQSRICLKPSYIVNQLMVGDLLYIDFNDLILRVADVSSIKSGYISVRAVTKGSLSGNKAVVVDSVLPQTYDLPSLTEKDKLSIKLGLENDIKYFLASFIRSGECVDKIREVANNSMQIISKIECSDALSNLDEIITKSDYVFIDRGDLSKEVPIEKIPLIQKIIIKRAQEFKKCVFVATNFLETMTQNKRPTRAEANDVVNTVLDGAYGLVLAAETAIGKYPMRSINMLNALIKNAELGCQSANRKQGKVGILGKRASSRYLLNNDFPAKLIQPHGGQLVDRFINQPVDAAAVASLYKIRLNEDQQMDVEQIAIGTFSPIKGFMVADDFWDVLDKMKLSNGVVWTIPIFLDVTEAQAKNIAVGDQVALVNGNDNVLAIMDIEDKYGYRPDKVAEKLYYTNSSEHPGVRWLNSLGPVIIGGKINLLQRKEAEFKQYELTPRQVRRLFDERGWAKVVGFHTRNVIHRSHEFIQLDAMEKEYCDGLFVHPIVGKKKTGDFYAEYIIKSYELMMKSFYPRDKVVFSVFSTFSRYAGPREAVFTALCRKNFGCSHFIVGRDHTGVGSFYHPKASHEIFDKLSEIGIQAVKFDDVFYSKKLNKYVHKIDNPQHDEDDRFYINGTQARKIFKLAQAPPAWFMRPEVSRIILDAVNSGQEVFVEDKSKRLGKVIWFTGLSGSGKTTIANKKKERLELMGKSVRIIDGDDIRKSKHKRLGFSRDDIRENNRLIAELARDAMEKFDFVLVSIISPYREDRMMARSIVGGNFVELFVNCPIEECINRDAKGLYRKALNGEIDNFIGVSKLRPYEPPTNPDIEVKSDQLNIEECVEKILNYLDSL